MRGDRPSDRSKRSPDLAILKTFGFLKRQVRGAVAWQAATLAGISLLFGVPVGIAAGRWAWRAFAQQIGVIPVPVFVAWSWLLIPATILLAVAVSFVPSLLAARTEPALVLRSE